jgi:hypothetical protein
MIWLAATSAQHRRVRIVCGITRGATVKTGILGSQKGRRLMETPLSEATGLESELDVSRMDGGRES